jgi:hypothetical protein
VDLNLYSAADSAGTFPENYKICKKQLPMKVLARNHYKYEAIQWFHKKLINKKETFLWIYMHWEVFWRIFCGIFSGITCGFFAGKFDADLSSFSVADFAGTFHEDFKIHRKQLPTKVLARNKNMQVSCGFLVQIRR